MAHYALLDRNNVVVQVITGVDENEGIYDWELFYTQETRLTAKRTSYNTRAGKYWIEDPERGRVLGPDQSKAYRKNYAGVGYKYDSGRDAFIPPQPFVSWTLNEDSCDWDPPVSYPSDGKSYQWDELTMNWVELAAPEISQ